MDAEGQHPATGTAAGAWYFREGKAVSGPMSLSDLRHLAEQARLEPDTDISNDGQTWRRAKTLADLKMAWIAYREDGTTYGPFNMLAAPHLVKRGLIHSGTAIRKIVGGLTTTRSVTRSQGPSESAETAAADDGTGAALASLAAPWVDDVDLFQIISQLAEACRRKALGLRDAERDRDQERDRRITLERSAAERETAFKEGLAALDAKYREAIEVTRKTHEHLLLREQEFKALEQSGRQIQLELDRRIEALERRLDERVHTSADLKRRLRQESARREEAEASERETVQRLRDHIRDLESHDAVPGNRSASVFRWKRRLQEETGEIREQLDAERRRHEDTWQWSLEKEHAMGKRIAELEQHTRQLETALDDIHHAPAQSTEPRVDSWRLRLDHGAVYGPVSLSELLEWTIQCRVAPGHEVSVNGATWMKASDVPELGMDWTVMLDDGSSYGPLNLLTIHQLMRDGMVSPNARLIKRTGTA